MTRTKVINTAQTKQDVLNTAIGDSRVLNSVPASSLPTPFNFCFNWDVDYRMSDPVGVRPTITQSPPFDANVQWFWGDGSFDIGNAPPPHLYSSDGIYTVTCCMDKPLSRIRALTIPLHSITYPDFTGMTSLESLECRGLQTEKHRLTTFPPMTILTEAGAVFSNLQLDRGNIAGSLPAWVGSLSQLFTLNIAQNAMSGALPASLWGLSNLVNLSIGINAFTGSIPSAISGLTSIQLISMTQTMLSGSLPAEIGQLTTLVQLSLDRCMFGGKIPSFQVATNLQIIGLWGNTMNVLPPPPTFGITNTALAGVFVNDMGFNTPSVNDMLVDVNSAGTFNGTLNIGGASNASPTGGAGNADVLALQGRGWVVIHN